MGGYAALCLYLDTQSGSRWLANEVATRLAEQIGARVEIGEARIGLPGHIALKGVKLYDRADSLMITAETLNGSVSVRQLLSTGKVRLRSIALLDGEAHIYQLREDTATNIQFLFDAFKSEEEPSRPTDISISQLVVQRFKFSFDQRDKSAPLPGRALDRRAVQGAGAHAHRAGAGPHGGGGRRQERAAGLCVQNPAVQALLLRHPGRHPLFRRPGHHPGLSPLRGLGARGPAAE